MIFDIITSIINCFESIAIIPGTEAPRIFLIPISFVFCSVVNETSPNKPRQEIKIARAEK